MQVRPADGPDVTGINIKRGLEEESATGTAKTPRSSSPSMASDCAGQAMRPLCSCLDGLLKEVEILTESINMTPLVAANPAHAAVLDGSDEYVKKVRSHVFAATDRMQKDGVVETNIMQYTALNVMELAARPNITWNKHI